MTRPRTNTLRWGIFIFLGLIIGLGVWLGASLFSSAGKVTSDSGKNSILSMFSSKDKLQGENEGRTNILLLGKGGDNHPGGNLTDSMEVISVDWTTNKIAFISLPRDLWVQLPGGGYSKINAANYYGDLNAKKTGSSGGKESSQVVGQVLGIPIHYYVTIDFQAFKEIVDKIGGVDIYVDKAISDPFYPAVDMVHYDPFYITVGQHHLDGVTALKYARSRETTSDFDRSRRQQQIITAIKQKLMSAQTFSNPVKITDLFSIVGNHVRTNMSVGEIKNLWTKTQAIDQANAASYVFDTNPKGPLVALQDERGYIIIPRKGIGKYDDLQNIAKNIFTLTVDQMNQGYAISPEAQAEIKPKINTSETEKVVVGPRIQILNAASQKDAATKLSQTLKSEGFNVVLTGNANDSYRQTTIYSCDNSTKTNINSVVKTLSNELKAVVKTKTSCTGYDIQIIIGQI